METKLFFEHDYNIRELVDEFTKNKDFETVYEITFIDNEDELEYVTTAKFSDLEHTKLKQLQAQYGMENIHSHLNEVFDDPDLLSDTFVNPAGVKIIDLDHPIKLIKLTLHLLKSGETVQNDIHIAIHPNDYRNLVVLGVEDSGMNFNKLRHANQGIYERMLREIDRRISTEGYYSENYPYLVTLTEIEEDVKKFLQAHPEIKPSNGVGYSIAF